MIYTYHGGNLFENRHVEGLINPVNCQGIMGKGLALEFKNHFPDNFEQYRDFCVSKLLRPGGVFITFDKPRGQYIINLATKKYWKEPSEYSWIEAGLSALIRQMHQVPIGSVAMPRIGCGLGGLDWGKVKTLIHEYFESEPSLVVEVYE